MNNQNDLWMILQRLKKKLLLELGNKIANVKAYIYLGSYIIFKAIVLNMLRYGNSDVYCHCVPN